MSYDRNECKKVEDMCASDSSVRVGWAVENTGEKRVLLAFDYKLHGLSVSVEGALKIAESLRQAAKDATEFNHTKEN